MKYEIGGSGAGAHAGTGRGWRGNEHETRGDRRFCWNIGYKKHLR